MLQKKEKAALAQPVHKLLALDQASNVSGYAIFYDGELKTSGSFHLKDKDLGERLYQMRLKVNSLIEEYDINEIVFEDIQLQKNIGDNVLTFKILAEIFGIIYELATELKIKNQAIAPLTWKNGIGLEGKTRPVQKANAIKYVKNKYKIEVDTDEADAICIGTYAIELNKKKSIELFDWSD